ncbi:MAG: M23 family metallopeptidase [Spirochaetota bacterium]
MLVVFALLVAVVTTGELGAESILSGTDAEPPSTTQGALVVAPPIGEPGGIVRVFAHGGGGPAAVELIDAEGRTVVHAPAIEVRMTGVVRLRAYLVGVDPTRTPGSYRLRGVSAEGETVFERGIEITEHTFRAERITLNRALTSLRSDDDPRKVEQTRILTELVLSRDPDALYHLDELRWPLPEETRLTSLFGDRRTFVYSDGSEAPAVHTGLDLAAPVGTPVRSSGRGIVRMASDRILTGKTIVIEHLPGVFSLYYHLDEMRVAVGEIVGTHTVVGTVGATGLATGAHLHWEIRVGGVPVCPAAAAARALVTGLPAVGGGAVDAESDNAPPGDTGAEEAAESVP